MFSSFKSALENLAQVPNENHLIRRGSDPLTVAQEDREPPSRSASLDMQGSRSPSSPLSSSQLAESALSNLRKSFASNRAGSPGPGARSKPSQAVATSTSDSAIRPAKSRLEDRLRASFTVGDLSRSSTPESSARSTPPPAKSVSETPPTSVPLPASPILSPIREKEKPSVVRAPSLADSAPRESTEQPRDPLPASQAEPNTEQPLVSVPASQTAPSTELRHPEADVPLPDDADGSDVIDVQTVPDSSVLGPLPSQESLTDESAVECSTKETYSRPSLEESPPKPSPEESLLKISPEASLTSSTEEPLPTPSSVEPSLKHTVEANKEMHVDTNSTSVEPSVLETRNKDVEAIQEQLKLLERRFADVTSSFKRLQAEKDAADKVVRELTPLEGLQDIDGFRDYLQNMTSKVEISEDEIKRLNGKLTRQEDRIEEMRDTHRLESLSQSDQIEQLRKQVAETEALFKAAQDATSQTEGENAKRQVEIDKLKANLEKSQSVAKEEEEKRVKAISLLKTVRQKLVKAEKEREDVQKELAAVKEKDKGEKDREEAERSRLQKEVEAVSAERDRAVAGLKSQFDKEVVALKERYEKEISALKGQFELEAVTTKSMHMKELAAKDNQISILEKSVNNLSNDKNSFFEQMQLRQAENESLQSHLESLQSQNAELQYQVREANERLALLSENLAEARREQEVKSQAPMASAEEVARLLSTTQSKYETKLADMRRDLLLAEKERNDSEAEWSRKLRAKSREADDLKRVLASSAKTREESEETVSGLTSQIDQLKQEIQDYRRQIADLQRASEQVNDLESNLKDITTELKAKVSVLERTVEESKAREAHLKVTNKTLREELRKVQSSAALLERQRNPGVGYWSRQDNGPADGRTSTSSSPDIPSRTGSPTPFKSDEEVNLEYLRNVILQFLEHKEMRPNLVKVLSIILHFTPQETRRLIAKV